MADEILLDWKHWLGWAITTLAIIVYSHLIGVHVFHTESFIPNINALGLMFVVVIVDYLKHKGELQ